MSRTYLEFFAGGGMVRAGLADRGWHCAFANDVDAKKGTTYALNWGRNGVCPELAVADVRSLVAHNLPAADLAWGSFPCQDLSLAGGGAGLKGARSGTFFPFWQLMRDLGEQGRGPAVIAVENVPGTLTSHGGADFAAIVETFAEAGYRCGALVIDAERFVPQSRPRLFVVGVADGVSLPAELVAPEPLAPFHTAAVQRAHAGLDAATQARWIWWKLPVPARRASTFAEIIEPNPMGVPWHSRDETAALLAMMSPVNLAKVRAAQASGSLHVGGVYRRTRKGPSGEKLQRAEIRFDEVAGCLRTPAGGSSRQTILVVEGERLRSRLLSARETARLMGLPESYALPPRYNDAYHLTGDGVVVPVVAHLAEHLFEPLIARGHGEQANTAA